MYICSSEGEDCSTENDICSSLAYIRSLEGVVYISGDDVMTYVAQWLTT